MKRTSGKLYLKRETLGALDLAQVAGQDTLTFVTCTVPTGNGCYVSKAFTNCTYCPSYSADGSTCTCPDVQM